MSTNISPEVMAQVQRARQDTLQMLAQVAGEQMEATRQGEHGIYNVNSSESKILRSGMAATALHAAEHIAQGVFQALLRRIEAVALACVSAATYEVEKGVLTERVAALEKRIVTLESRPGG